MVVVRFKGVGDRSAAEALTGTELFVDRAVLPTELADEEFYHTDLVGLSVVDTEGIAIGAVAAVLNFGAGDILEISGPGLKGVLVPFTKAAVPLVDLSTRTIRVDRIAAGLVDDAADDDPQRSPPGRAAVSIRSVGRADRAMPGATGELPRQRADALSRDVPGTTRPVARRPRARSRRPGRSSPCRSATSQPTGIARSTTRRPAAVPAW